MTISPKFIFSHPAHFLAFGFGAGLSPYAPGTVGTLVAFPLYWLMLHWLSGTAILVAILLMFVVGVWACQCTGQALGVADYGGIVWDEIVAMLLVLCFTPPTLVWYVVAFLLFRLFDIWKPFPIGYADRHIHGGFGVMFDDLLAAIYAIVCLLLLVQWGVI
ncbi:MAG: phosphatidylglycerophosphatase A [Betaproteobacteria bacterium CG2_30_59_46]|nr:MAG: phosphatidylglycerophosphatase A [Betaproteobacteria bacterium CG2_30_59_46]PIQ14177.1 MAG: phosphatidylglycerophosphatase A [Hydrogenophilales bacterium CG18_big_fil_WC_8_21_14_2_50_58_12]PIY00856.1 MAG: phosphatidylglycerophosphatase A [Hydrogenophilales bacterium CG_4_10_14_3_um_filter_58_23]PJB08824.1 MAG: phosphatidylglycerophosphatase A [Hydrogenophilales bacterium CG_4_9_14_3_um_filter_59_35]